MRQYRVYRSKYSGTSGTVSARRQLKVTYDLGDIRWFESGARVAWDYSEDIDGNHKRAVMAAVEKNLTRLSGTVEDVHFGGDDGNGILWVVIVDVG